MKRYDGTQKAKEERDKFHPFDWCDDRNRLDLFVEPAGASQQVGRPKLGVKLGPKEWTLTEWASAEEERNTKRKWWALKEQEQREKDTKSKKTQ